MKKPQPMKKPLPFILVNMAMTADGKIATANRVVHSFSSKRDLEHLYELRATADAVMCGARTVEISRTILGPGGEKYRKQRLKRGLAGYNLRIVASGSGSINPHAAIFKKHISPVIILTTARASKAKLRSLATIADEVKVCGEREINFAEALRWLRAKWGVKRLLCEGGGELNNALFRADLADELHLTISPKIFGGSKAPTIADGEGYCLLSKAATLQIKSFKLVGNEVFAMYYRTTRR
jgi:riboflavin-specific deaminase-like protein